MEFHEKLQKLRKERRLTQEELAEALFVSRTAVSKWESGRGYPNIESLKAISKFFRVTVDELLSGEELLTLSEEEHRKKENRFRGLVFGLLDLGAAMLVFLPFFGQKTGDLIQSVSLLALTGIAPHLRIGYDIAVIGMVAVGVLTLALQNCEKAVWVRNQKRISLFFNTVGALLFVISQQPYAATFLLLFLIIKARMLIKWE
ncbi:MAG: helix-turn-helix transcriptional regulator [Clostridia bacterium]|nr:helix-turn-helix transcriptional regulator [Clostridia bacterium]